MSEHSYDPMNSAAITDSRIYAQTGAKTFATQTTPVSPQSALDMALAVALDAANAMEDVLAELHRRLAPVLAAPFAPTETPGPGSEPRTQGSPVTEQVYVLAQRTTAQRRSLADILDRLEV